MNTNLFISSLHVFILASNVLTAPPPCSSSAISAPICSDNEISSKNDFLTIEQINEIFKKQIEKLEGSSNIEVNISQNPKQHFPFFSLLEKNSRRY